jgi:hypothetical protein
VIGRRDWNQTARMALVAAGSLLAWAGLLAVASGVMR